MNIKRYMKRYWYFYAIGTAVMLISMVMDLFTPYIMGQIVDRVIVGGDTSPFLGLALGLIGITIGRAILGYSKEISFDLAGVNISKRIRKDMFDHIQGLSFHFFDEKNTGELMARIKEDAEKIWFACSFGLMLVIDTTLYLIVASIIMFSISVPLTLIALVFLPFLAFLALRLEKEIGQTYEQISEQNAILNTTAQENLVGVRLVKAFAREKHEIQKFLEKNKTYYELNLRQGQIFSKFFPLIEAISNVLPVALVVIGGLFVMNEVITIGTLVQYSGYIMMVIWPMRMCGWLSNMMAEAFASNKKIGTIMKETSKIVEVQSPTPVTDIEAITFEAVSLELNGQQVLKDISFNLEKGKTLAVMGTTGSGKTSLVNVLLRFYDVTAGRIKVNGTDVKEVALKGLRENISVVMQDVFLFSDTITDNIKFGKKETIDDERMVHSATIAQAHDFIDKLDEGYETVIGERGIGLSGGQKQRISIARAFAKDAPVVIFDDSTSALDMETEWQIQNAIKEKSDLTKIIIAHRISSVKHADEILILDEGEVVERGTHDQLIKLKGRYYETFIEQYEGYEDEVAV